MGKLIDLTGQKFGKLTVIKRVENTKRGAARWLCICECGNKTVVIGDELRKGTAQSCGCHAKEIARETARKHVAGKNKTHDKTGTLIYKEWTEMKRRCFNKTDTSYKNYRKRGITVCDRWRDSFETFYEDVSKLPHFGEQSYTLNRIDNNGNYEPNNVEWATPKEQANNRRTTRFVEYNGQKLSLKQLSEKYNIPYNKLYKRYAILNWSIEKAVNTP